jgi:hypothetical protein
MGRDMSRGGLRRVEDSPALLANVRRGWESTRTCSKSDVFDSSRTLRGRRRSSKCPALRGASEPRGLGAWSMKQCAVGSPPFGSRVVVLVQHQHAQAPCRLGASANEHSEELMAPMCPGLCCTNAMQTHGVGLACVDTAELG